MNDKFLSQDEINSLIKKNHEINSNQDISDEIKNYLNNIGYDLMNSVTKRLSQITRKEISLSKPHSENIVLYDYFKNLNEPYILAEVENVGSIKGSYLILLKANDAVVLGSLLTGGNGNVDQGEITLMQLNTIKQTLNVMVGSLSAELSKNENIKIRGKVKNFNLINDSDVKIDNIYLDDNVMLQSYGIEVNGILQTDIIQILSIDYVEELVTQSSKTNDTSSNIKQTISEEDNMSKEEIAVKKPKFSPLSEPGINTKVNNIDLILDVPLEFSVILGHTKKSIREVLSLNPGSVIELNKYTEEPLEVYVNGKLIAHGEVVVVDENFGVRITNITSQEDRIKGLK